MSEKLKALFTTINEGYTWLTEGSTNGAKTLSKILFAFTIVLGLVTWTIAERYFVLLDDVKVIVKTNNDKQIEIDKLKFERDQFAIKAEGLSQTLNDLISKHPSIIEKEEVKEPQKVTVPTYEEAKETAKPTTKRDDMQRRRRLIEIING